MVTVVVSPQDGATQQRRFALPACAFDILAQLERAGSTIEEAQRLGQGALKITFHIKGKTTKAEVVSMFE